MTRERLILRYGLLALFAGVTLYFAISEPSFRSVDNVVSILQSVSTVGIIALGVTVSMVVGGFDLSIGANAGFTVMLCAICLVMFAWPTFAVVPVALLGGLLIGVVQSVMSSLWPEGARLMIYAAMAAVLLARPAGLLGCA